MKKKLFLLGCALLFSLTGCGAPNNSDDKIEVIADFENWKPDFATIKLSYGFGSIDRNKEERFVKGGNYSALVRPKGHPGRKDIVPTFYFPLRSKDYNFNKGDLRKYDNMTCSFYNDSNEDVPVTIGFLSKVETIYNVVKSEGVTYNLKANSWTDINHIIDLDFLNMYINIEEVPGLYFEFEYQDVDDISFAPKLYLDNVYFHLADKIREVSTIFTLEGNEICDFEKDFQKGFMSVGDNTNAKLSFDIVGKDGDIAPTSGEKMLKIKSHAKDHWVNWTHFKISEVYMKQTPLKDLSLEEIEQQKWAFCYDIRVEGLDEGTLDQFIAPTFFTTGVQNELYFGGQEKRARVGEWKTVEIVFNKEYVFDAGVSRTLTLDYLTRIGDFHFSIPDEKYDYYIYVDNIRLERVEEVAQFEEVQEGISFLDENTSDYMNITLADSVCQPTTGPRMLYVQTKAKTENLDGNSHIVFDETFMKNSGFANIPVDEIENNEWAFCYDIRVEGASLIGKEIMISPYFYKEGKTGEIHFAHEQIKAVPGKWNNVRINLNQEYLYEGGSAKLTKDFFENIGEFHLAYPNEEYNYDIYIDNIRLKKVAGY